MLLLVGGLSTFKKYIQIDVRISRVCTYALFILFINPSIIYTYIYIRTHQAFESQLQDEDADFTDDESEACEGGAMQDQRGNETYTGKVSCLMCYDTLVLPLFTSHVTLVNDGPQLLCHPDE